MATFDFGVLRSLKLMDKAVYNDVVIEIVRRVDADPGFKVLPWRRIVGGTLGFRRNGVGLCVIKKEPSTFQKSSSWLRAAARACADADEPINEGSQQSRRPRQSKQLAGHFIPSERIG